MATIWLSRHATFFSFSALQCWLFPVSVKTNFSYASLELPLVCFVQFEFSKKTLVGPAVLTNHQHRWLSYTSQVKRCYIAEYWLHSCVHTHTICSSTHLDSKRASEHNLLMQTWRDHFTKWLLCLNQSVCTARSFYCFYHVYYHSVQKSCQNFDTVVATRAG